MAFVKELLQRKPADVWTIEPQATVYQALEIMADKNIGALPVMDGARIIGMVSERDYARKVILMGRSSRATTVADLMSHPVHTVGPNDTIETCMALMTERHVRHLPVLENGKLSGIISIGDVMKAIIAKQTVLIKDLENFINGARS